MSSQFDETVSPTTTVLYDGACRLCSKEIAFYRRRAGAERITWLDVSETQDKIVAPGITKQQAMKRFHVIGPNGVAVSGGAAFAELWAALPAFRTVGLLLRRPPLVWILNIGYDVFLRARPWLQRRLANNAGNPTCCEVPARSEKERCS